jgi:hypothetical protein
LWEALAFVSLCHDVCQPVTDLTSSVKSRTASRIHYCSSSMCRNYRATFPNDSINFSIGNVIRARSSDVGTSGDEWGEDNRWR